MTAFAASASRLQFLGTLSEPSEQFEVVVDEVAAEQIFGFLKNGLERLLQVGGIVRKADDADLSALPGVLVIQFRHSHVETRPKAVLQAAQNLAFVLEGMGVRDKDFQGQQTDRHETLGVKRQTCCSISLPTVAKPARVAHPHSTHLSPNILRRDPSLTMFARDDDPGRIVRRWLRRESASAWRSIRAHRRL